MENKGLTARQFQMLLWVAMLSPLVRQAPAAMLGKAGQGAWLSALLTLPAAAMLSALLSAVLKTRAPGEDMGAMLSRTLGKTPARGLFLLLGLWLCFCAGFTLRSGADRLVAAVYPESPAGLFAALTLLLSLPAALGERRGLGRMAELTAPLLLGLFALVLALSLPKAELSSLRPEAELRGTVLGAAPLLGTVSAGAFFLLLWGENDTKAPFPLFFYPLAGLSLTALGLCAAVTGRFGAALAEEMSYPFFVLLRNLELPHLLERGEALVAAAWVISDYLLTAAQLQMAARALGYAGIVRKMTVWLASGLSALSAVLCAPDAFALMELGRRFIPGVDLVAGFGLPVAVIIAGKGRKKMRDAEGGVPYGH